VARLGEERGLYRVLMVYRREGDYWGNLGVDGWIIVRWICRRCVVGMDWIGLAQDGNGWRRLVCAVMNLRIP